MKKLRVALSAGSCAVFLFLSLAGPTVAVAEGDLQRVNHIIIVMQENHSFDNYFGTLGLRSGQPLSQRERRLPPERS